MRKVGLTLMLFSCVCLVACEKPPESGYTPPKVSVAAPLKMDVPEYEYFTGRTSAKDSAEIQARVEGYLKEVRFRDGEEVKQGDTLFIIEQDPYETRLLAAKAQLQQSQAKLKLAEANVRRARQLLQKNAVTVEEADQKEADVLIAKAQIALDEQQVRQAEIDYNYTIVKSPIDGKTGRHLVTPGNLVGVGEKTLLTTVEKMDPMEVFFDMPQSMLERLLKRYNTAIREARQLEPPAELGLPTETGYTQRGILNFLDNRVDEETGTIQVRAVFDNAKRWLYSGMFVRLRIPGPGTEGALLVKEDTISTDLGGKYLMVIGKDDVVERRYIELGSAYGDMRVASHWDPKTKTGLREQDKYIVKGLLRARPGLPVEPEVIEVKPEHVTQDELEAAENPAQAPAAAPPEVPSKDNSASLPAATGPAAAPPKPAGSNSGAKAAPAKSDSATKHY